MDDIEYFIVAATDRRMPYNPEQMKQIARSVVSLLSTGTLCRVLEVCVSFTTRKNRPSNNLSDAKEEEDLAELTHHLKKSS